MKKILFTSAAVAMLAVASYAQDGAEESAATEGAKIEFKQVEKCVEFKNGTGDYDKTCIKSGLKEMKENTCYTLNPDRGAAPQWINDFASQSWWWVETECFETVAVEVPESSSSENPVIDESSSSVEVPVIESSSETPVVPAKKFELTEKCIKYVHGAGGYFENCYNSGLQGMEKGACYTFNPERYDQFKNEKYVNGTAYDTYWWVKTDCFDTVYVEESSSSVEPVVEESSSSFEPVVEESSSSVAPVVEESSSSVAPVVEPTEPCVAFSIEVENIASKCFNDGLYEMEDGACYKLNPAMAETPAWELKNDASNEEVWMKTACVVAEPESSSSEEPVSSSSEEPVSSSEESSSSEEPASSSSEDVDSSSSEESSSSVEPVYELVEKCVEFKNGTGNYGTTCIKSGLKEMEEGACYTLNPDRANENPLWINDFASQEWWWVKTDCYEKVLVESSSSDEPESSSSEVAESSSSDEPESSSSEDVESSSSDEPVVEESSSSFELVEKCIAYVHGAGGYFDNCYKSGLQGMEKGACYTFNPERYDQFKNEKYVNGTAYDTYWWVKTDCYDTVAVEVPASSSSEVVESSSSDEQTEESSSSEVVESSSSDEQTEESSSSEVVESSSSDEQTEESSSSEEKVEVCVAFENGKGNYGKNCFKSGLLEMEEGKCYTMNPDRANENPIWINNMASQTWWWVETSCYAESAPKAAPKPALPELREVVMSLDKRTLRVASSSDAVKTLHVFDMNGKLLHSESFSGMAKDVDFAQFAGKGVLLVRVSEGNKLVSMKRMSIR